MQISSWLLFSLPFLLISILAVYVTKQIVLAIYIGVFTAKGVEIDSSPEFKRFKKKIKWLATACVLIVYVFLASTFNIVDPFYHPENYTHDSWIAADAEKRGRMINSLLSQQNLIGMTKSEVQNMLGPPNDSLNKGDFFYYNLGHMGGRPSCRLAFPYKLRIIFKDGIVEKHEIND